MEPVICYPQCPSVCGEYISNVLVYSRALSDDEMAALTAPHAGDPSYALVIAAAMVVAAWLIFLGGVMYGRAIAARTPQEEYDP